MTLATLLILWTVVLPGVIVTLAGLAARARERQPHQRPVQVLTIHPPVGRSYPSGHAAPGRLRTLRSGVKRTRGDRSDAVLAPLRGRVCEARTERF